VSATRTTSNERSPGLPRTVWALGFVSLFMDTSSEAIHALLPLFLTGVLGANVAMVGIIDGVGEATASITKLFSGYISDRLGKRKPLIVLGYGLAALSKPLFALAGSAGVVLGARFADRIGKGIRGAPRDALVADVTPPEMHGRAFGLRQSLDTVGAFLGPLAAIGLMYAFADDFRRVFWLAAIPALCAVLVLVLFVRDKRPAQPGRHSGAPLRLADCASFDGRFWGVVAIAVVFTLARFSEAFLILETNAEGLPVALAPLVLVVLNIVYALGAYPAGALSDRIGAGGILLAGIGCLVAGDLLLALTSGLVLTFVGIALWGAHMALTQGVMAKLVADCAPEERRGAAFGVFHLASGLALLAASVLAGVLWDAFGAQATFLAGGGFALLAGVMLLLIPAGRAASR
jgi:MFS family permease